MDQFLPNIISPNVSRSYYHDIGSSVSVVRACRIGQKLRHWMKKCSSWSKYLRCTFWSPLPKMVSHFGIILGAKLATDWSFMKKEVTTMFAKIVSSRVMNFLTKLLNWKMRSKSSKITMSLTTTEHRICTIYRIHWQNVCTLRIEFLTKFKKNCCSTGCIKEKCLLFD